MNRDGLVHHTTVEEDEEEEVEERERETYSNGIGNADQKGSPLKDKN